MKDEDGRAATSPKFPVRTPWWVSVLLAIGSYCTFKFLIPDLHLTNPTLAKLAQAAPTFAPIITIPFLLLAAKQLYDKDIGSDGKSDSREEEDTEEH